MEDFMKTIRSYLMVLLAFSACPLNGMQQEAERSAVTDIKNQPEAFMRIKNNAYKIGAIVLEMAKKTLASKTKEIKKFNAIDRFYQPSAAQLDKPSMNKIKTALRAFCGAIDHYGITPYGPQYIPALRSVTLLLRSLKEAFERFESIARVSAAAAQAAKNKDVVTVATARASEASQEYEAQLIQAPTPVQIKEFVPNKAIGEQVLAELPKMKKKKNRSALTLQERSSLANLAPIATLGLAAGALALAGTLTSDTVAIAAHNAVATSADALAAPATTSAAAQLVSQAVASTVTHAASNAGSWFGNIVGNLYKAFDPA